MDAAPTVDSTPTAMPAELQELALALAMALHKRAIYPPGHPLLQGAVERLWARMQSAVSQRGAISLGIAQQQVVIEGIATDDEHRLLRDFATHLHQHQIAAIRILPGVKQDEVNDFLGAVATPAARAERPLGILAPEEMNRWEHLLLYPAAFDKLELVDEKQKQGSEPLSRAAELWLGLARAALSADGSDSDVDAEVDPGRVAGAINARAQEDAYDDVIVGYLLRMAEELTVATGPAAEAVRGRLSRLVRDLNPETLSRLLEMGGDLAQRGRFVTRSADALSARAVIDILRAAADNQGQAISAALTRLLVKLAHNAESSRTNASDADKALRRHVKRILSGWTLGDANSGAYNAVLGEVSGTGRSERKDLRRDEAEPERILDISLEADIIGPDTETALARLVHRDGLAAVIERLTGAPETPTRESLIDRLVNPALMREQLHSERPDLRSLEHGVRRLRDEALDPLLDALEDRGERDASWLVDLIVHVGSDAAPRLGAAFGRLNAISRRALLAVFERWNAWPIEVNLLLLAKHDDPQMRRDAVRILLKSDATRTDGVRIGLRDQDERVFSQALSAAMKGGTRETVGLLIQRAEDVRLRQELRTRAVRAIAAARWPEAMHWLINSVVRRRWLLAGLQLRKKSEATLAAMAGLAAHWKDTPEAGSVLALAARSKDEEVRRAAMTRSGTA